MSSKRLNQAYGSRKLHSLNSDTITFLVDALQKGDRQSCRGRIAVDLDINDALAEVSLKHLESVVSKKDFNTQSISQQLKVSESVSTETYQKILGEIFGIHGRAAATIIKKTKAK
ncbi:MAG: hypothetical protein HRU19_09905 [Pseudobacteriovorax sp.]|nr:hypothetical protein [Pseudobacteriovorax sp.]